MGVGRLMAELQVEADAGEVGLDAGRLARIDRHFYRYVDDGRLPGWLILVSRRGRVAHLSTYGWRDRERALPVEADTVWRLASMTKPITSVAAMMLYEEGAFELKDPVERWLPSFEGMRVYRGGSGPKAETRPAVEPIRVWHLLTHTAGLTYGFHYAHPVDALYRAAGFEWGTPGGTDLEGCCDAWARFPLLFEPGSEWNYSVATDVLGRLVEVVSGQPLDEFFRTRIFEPLGMTDTAFWAGEGSAAERLAASYVANPAGPHAPAVPIDGSSALRRPAMWSGGGGLVGTAGDYHRFALMLRGGGCLEGVRLLSPRTVAYMARNHRPGGADLERVGRHLFAETTFDGVGFGLGVSVVIDPAAAKVLCGQGEYGWGGAFSTAFWVAPEEDVTALFFTQLLPSSTHPIRSELKQLVYQAIV
jgi:CubicO group peptidase (beta-lactamase class C family)